MLGPLAWVSGEEHPAFATAIAAATLTNPMTRINLCTPNNLPFVLPFVVTGQARAYPCSTAAAIRPRGGEPRSISAVWKRLSVKSAPQAALARSRSAMISSFPQV